MVPINMSFTVFTGYLHDISFDKNTPEITDVDVTTKGMNRDYGLDGVLQNSLICFNSECKDTFIITNMKYTTYRTLSHVLSFLLLI